MSFSSASFFWSHTFHAFRSQSIAPLTYWSRRGASASRLRASARSWLASSYAKRPAPTRAPGWPDLVAQRVEGRSRVGLHLRRCARNAALGFGLHGPMVFWWINVLEGPLADLLGEMLEVGVRPDLLLRPDQSALRQPQRAALGRWCRRGVCAGSARARAGDGVVVALLAGRAAHLVLPARAARLQAALDRHDGDLVGGLLEWPT